MGSDGACSGAEITPGLWNPRGLHDTPGKRQAAARAFGAEQWFDNHQELVSSPKVDLVVITVKVPHHFELVTAAITAGKFVYCEWPLGNGLAEAVEMSERARKSGVRVTGVVEGGAVASLHYRGGLSRRTTLLWEINGTEGDLRLTAPTGHAQLTQLSLFGGRGDDRTLQPLTVSDSYRHVPGDLPVPAAEGEPKYDDLKSGLPKARS
jgi:predicted dehydrogenase